MEPDRVKHLTRALYSINSNNQGQILDINENFIIVGCKKGSLKIRTLQAPSKKAMSSPDYIRGQRLELGKIIF